MKIIDLTHEIVEGMPVYPGTEPPEIKIATTIEKDGFEERLITMFSHTGTHMDAPCHILKGGSTLSDFDISDFTGRAVLIDVRGMNEVTVEHVQKYSGELENAKFAVLHSGWDKLWGTPEYFKNFPVLNDSAAELLATFDLKGICMDMISIDPADTVTYANHRIIFKKGLVIVENLRGLESIGTEVFELTCLPLNIKGGDGSPVRAFALA
ncbi:MAG: hydrolase [Denitrovibrio sp.]|nr:MAG: hydrolase [Denitrovibrio sp.]